MKQRLVVNGQTVFKSVDLESSEEALSTDQDYHQVPNPGPSNETYSTGSAATDRGASGEWVLFCAVLVFLICSLGTAYLFSIDKDFSAFAYLLMGIAVVLTILSHGRYTSTRSLHGTATFFHRLQSWSCAAESGEAQPCRGGAGCTSRTRELWTVALLSRR